METITPPQPAFLEEFKNPRRQRGKPCVPFECSLSDTEYSTPGRSRLSSIKILWWCRWKEGVSHMAEPSVSGLPAVSLSFALLRCVPHNLFLLRETLHVILKKRHHNPSHSCVCVPKRFLSQNPPAVRGFPSAVCLWRLDWSKDSSCPLRVCWALTPPRRDALYWAEILPGHPQDLSALSMPLLLTRM